MTIWKNRTSKRQPEVISCSTLSADPRAVPVPVALTALISWVYLPVLNGQILRKRKVKLVELC